MRHAVAGVLAAMMLATCGMEPVVPAPTLEEQARPRAEERSAPDVLRLSGSAVWDGRPTLGGLWIARPGVESRRVLVEGRNGSAAATLLPNMSRDQRFQLSSDLAGVLGVSAGQGIAVRVTALVMPSAGASPLSADTPAVVPAVAESAARVTLSRPQAIQVAVFGVEANAHAAREKLAEAGLRAEIRRSGAAWRVTIPLGGAAGDGAPGELLAKVKRLGFADAYAVAL
ncbi:SPOR domain-containing protein [Haematobacter sp.]|uniref:SPOR domain-containing protein n=1 Tax=Haematobacter sp. TaxID=2953762 RepID=UPI0028B03702|nr:SPOR domain-containing protein [Haematobacter sp.]